MQPATRGFAESCGGAQDRSRVPMTANAVRPTCIATNATANTSPRSPNAPGKATAMIRVATMVPTSITRTGRRSGSNQLVTQAVSTQAHHSASKSRAVCSAPRKSRCSASRWDNWVIAKT